MIQSAKIPAVKAPIIISRILSADPCFIVYTHGLRFGELAGFVGAQGTKAVSWLHPLRAAEFIWGYAQGNKNQLCRAKHQTLTESSLSYLKLFKFSRVTKMFLSALIQNQWRCQKNWKGQMKFRDDLMFVPKAWDHKLSKQWWSHLLLPIIKSPASNICFSTSVMNTCGLHLMIDWHIF